MLRVVMVAGLALAVAACAAEPRRRDFRNGGPEGRMGGGPPGAQPRTHLFISPSGEPFRGEDGLSAWFARADADHDGSLTPAEFQADAERFFHVLDTDGDGVVDGFEIRAYEEQLVPEIALNDFDRQPGQGGPGASGGGRRGGGMGGGGRRGGGMGRGGGGRGMGAGQGPQGAAPGGNPPGAGREGAARYSLINEPEPVANADENVDGKVSLEEWRHAAARRFAALDKARTGRLTLDALKGKVPPQKAPSPTPGRR